MPRELSPPYTPVDHVDTQLAERGFAVLSPAGLATLAGTGAPPLDGATGHWDDLPRDPHLRDTGGYRQRRHGSFVARAGVLEPVPHRAHWQPPEYNALHGGLERWFEPLAAGLVAAPGWAPLLLALVDRAARLRDHAGPWFVEAHAFRITTGEGLGRPTPEGAHRDGVDLVAVVLVDRVAIVGGETRVFEAAGPAGQRFTMAEPGAALLLDDARVIHESTPIRPAADGAPGHRDTLVLTFRAGGFQDPGV